MTSGNFKDYFSSKSDSYREYRPTYPDSLFEFLASISPSNELAWDCATGSGQAAGKLAKHFARVVATDASFKQVQNAAPGGNIFYLPAHAEQAPLHKNSVDLLTVAQALHWFGTEAFFAEAKRVLKKDGIIAVWSYNLLSITPELDGLIRRFYRDIIGNYWPPERRLVEKGYRDIPFPFTNIPCPKFRMSAEWSIADLVGYLRTWSAVKLYRQDRGKDPVEIIENEIYEKWGSNRQREILWPLNVIVGRNCR